MPPANVAIGDIVQVTIKSLNESPVNLNVLHYRCYALPTDVNYGPAMTELGQAIVSGINTITGAMSNAMNQDTTIDNVRVQRVRPVRDYYVQVTATTTGVLAGTALSANLTLALTKQVDTTGRGKSGRFFLGGLDSTALAGPNHFDNVYLINQVAPLRAALASGQVGLGGAYCWYPVCVTRNTATYSRVRNLTANNIVHVMRRRTVGHGI